MMLRARRLLVLGRILLVKWGRDDGTRLAAALAFFAALSLGPLLLIASVIAGVLLGREEVRSDIESRVGQLAGPEAASAIGNILENATLPGSGIVASAVALAGLAFAASNVFFQLQRALNEVWDIADHPDAGLRSTLRDRLEAFVTVLLVGVAVIASPVLRLLTDSVRRLLNEAVPGVPWLWSLLDLLVVATLFTFLFALVFKVVPSARIGWRVSLVGAAVTAVLFTLGSTAMAYYLQFGATTSLYGAAGSLMALLLWIYVSSQILLLGAEVTQLYARLRGQPIEPYGYAVRAADEQRLKREKVDELLRRLRGRQAAGNEGDESQSGS